MQGETFTDCNPRQTAAAILPESTGSSPKYSKLRAPSGERARLAPGPSNIRAGTSPTL